MDAMENVSLETLLIVWSVLLAMNLLIIDVLLVLKDVTYVIMGNVKSVEITLSRLKLLLEHLSVKKSAKITVRHVMEMFALFVTKTIFYLVLNAFRIYLVTLAVTLVLEVQWKLEEYVLLVQLIVIHALLMAVWNVWMDFTVMIMEVVFHVLLIVINVLIKKFAKNAKVDLSYN